jgi:hypothetical protein
MSGRQNTLTRLVWREPLCAQRMAAHATKCEPFTIPWGTPREAKIERNERLAGLGCSAAAGAV